jgi:hypothetical protein
MGFFGLGKPKAAQDRYAGKPFLKLVDSFVLKSIGCLDPAQESLLEQMAPKLQATFHRSGSWEDIVMAELHFQPEIRASIQNLWQKNQAIARQRGTELSPMQFVEMFVRDNVVGGA